MAQEIKRCAVLMVILLCGHSAAHADSAVPRKILALYDAGNVSDVFFTTLHQHAEMPLNYLGMELVFRDVNGPLPAEADMAGFRGVITWFAKRDEIQKPAEYCQWATSQMAHGRKLVILGRMGFYTEGTRGMKPECRELLRTLGVRFMGGFSDARYFMELAHVDRALMEFEHKLGPADELFYLQLRPMDPAAHVYLRMRRTDVKESDSALVFTSRHGGLAYDTYVTVDQEDSHKLHWRINPFHFFEEAFQLRGLPRPDPTTVNGTRIFYSHIDGDGIFNVSHIDQKSYSGEVIVDQILRPNPDIPISASIITGYLDIPQYNGERETELYRKIFELPNVEPATHGYAHPFIWKDVVDPGVTAANQRYKHKADEKVALTLPGYTYNIDKEVQGAVGMTRDLLQKLGIPKAVTLYQWTGDCLLPPEALRSAEAAKVWNMNGGDTRFDHQFDSVAFVFPLSIVEGGRRQVYASMSNENTYTNLWEGPYYGYGEVVQSFENTGSPRRVKPVNVYYHYYSGERRASLEAVKKAYDYARRHHLFPMPASRYPQIVTDFFATQIFATAGGWQVTTQGALRTLRFDAERRNVDLARSKGVLGFVHERGNLYVTLDQGKDHTVILTAARPQVPYLAQATFDVRAFRRDRGGVRFEKSGWMESELRLGGLRPNHVYRVQAGGMPGDIRSTAKGELEVVFPMAENGGRYQEVTVQPQ